MDETRNLVGNAATKVTAHERNWQMVFRVSFRANRVAPAGHGHAHHRQAEQKRTGTTPLPLLRVPKPNPMQNTPTPKAHRRCIGIALLFEIQCSATISHEDNVI